ncbi:MAG: helix-turn-helix transcriptional regulator [Bacteroidetes bacterium]|nr:helix-turn-helix transcriptional regulator [Bacteroidota bacterium]
MQENDKFLKALGKNIDRIRKEKKISFQEMSYRCDIEKSNLVKIAKHGENITANTLYKISKGLDVPLKTIFDFKY